MKNKNLKDSALRFGRVIIAGMLAAGMTVALDYTPAPDDALAPSWLLITGLLTGLDKYLRAQGYYGTAE